MTRISRIKATLFILAVTVSFFAIMVSEALARHVRY